MLLFLKDFIKILCDFEENSKIYVYFSKVSYLDLNGDVIDYCVDFNGKPLELIRKISKIYNLSSKLYVELFSVDGSCMINFLYELCDGQKIG